MLLSVVRRFDRDCRVRQPGTVDPGENPPPSLTMSEFGAKEADDVNARGLAILGALARRARRAQSTLFRSDICSSLGTVAHPFRLTAIIVRVTGSSSDVAERALARGTGAVARAGGALRNPAVAAPVAVAGLMLIAIVARIWMSRSIQAPWVEPDELEYSETAKSFIATGHYLFRDHPIAIHSIYPALISPAWFASSMQTTYDLAKAINVVLMTAAAVPLYLWARRLVAPLYAVLLVALYLAIPSFIYTGEILTDNAYVTAVVAALFALSLALERPTLARQLVALAFIGLAVAVRVQGIVFALIIPSAIALKLLLDLRAAEPRTRRSLLRTELRRYWPLLTAIVVVGVAYLGYKAARGTPLSTGLGAYQAVAQVHYSVREVARWTVYHFAELTFSVAVIPVSALVVLFGLAMKRATAPNPAERAFLAVAVASVVWTVVEVGAFASRFSLRIEERNMFNVAPILLLALVVWLGRGLPRPPGLTAAAVLIPATLLLAFPYEGFFTGSIYNDTFGLIPLWRSMIRLGGDLGETKILLAVGVLAVGLLFACVSRRVAMPLIAAAVLGFFVVSTNTVFGTVEGISAAARHSGGLVGDPSWIDHTVGKKSRVEFLYTTNIDVDQHILWQAEFWNRSLRRVFGVTSQDPSIPDVTAPLDPITGRITPALPADSPDRRPRYVVGVSGLDVGRPIASAGFLSLYRVRQPLGLVSRTDGLQPDGWTGSDVTYNRFVVPGNRPAYVDVSLSRAGIVGPPPAHVSIVVRRVKLVGGSATVGRVSARSRLIVRNGTSRTVRLLAPRPPFRVDVHVAPTFSPAQYGSTDNRQLGVRIRFVVRPR
jgi:hypothetical protein